MRDHPISDAAHMVSMNLFTFAGSLSEDTRERIRRASAERNFRTPRLAVRAAPPYELCVIVVPLGNASMFDLLDLESDLASLIGVPFAVVSARSPNGELLARSAVSL